MAFPSTIVFPLITGTLSQSGKPNPLTLEITDVITLSKQQGNIAGLGLYEHGVGGSKPNTVTVRKGRVNKFGLQTLTAKGTLVPRLVDSLNGEVSIDPKKGHAPFSLNIQMPVEWPEELMSQVLTAVSQSLGGVVLANVAAMLAAGNQSGSVLRASSAGEV